MTSDIKQWAIDNLNCLILDTETTGLYNCEIVDIAITKKTEILLNTLVKPIKPIPKEATRIHKISDNDVVNAPTFPEIYPKLKKLIEGKKILIYNADYDQKVINECCILHQLPIIKFSSDCVMLKYSEYVGEWNEYHGNYKWQMLPGSREHRAASDCLATYNVMLEMARSK